MKAKQLLGSRKVWTLLAAMVVLLAFVLFLNRSSDWWVHLSLRDGIEKITVYSGGLRVGDEEPAAVLRQPSVAIEEVVGIIERAYLYRKGIKFPSVIELDITYADGTQDYLCIGNNFIKLKSGKTSRTVVYKIRKSDSKLLCRLVLKERIISQ